METIKAKSPIENNGDFGGKQVREGWELYESNNLNPSPSKREPGGKLRRALLRSEQTSRLDSKITLAKGAKFKWIRLIPL